MIRRTFQYKLLATKRVKRLDDTRYLSSKVYNHCIALYKRYYLLYGKHLSVYALKKHLTKIKSRYRQEWKALGSQSIQDIALRIDKGYQLFFSERKAGNKRIQPPTFRKARNYQSFTFTQAGWKLQGNTLTLQGVRYKLYLSRPVEGTVKTVTLKKDRVGDWFACFSTVSEKVAGPHKESVAPGNTVGVDFGLKTLFTLSDGMSILSRIAGPPQFFKANSRALAKAGRAVSRKRKGSRNRRKAGIALARLHRRVANQRSNFHWQVATRLARTYHTVCVEDLDLRGMKALWGRKVSDLGFANQVDKMGYCLSKRGGQLVKVDKWFASSKTCYECGHHHKELTLSDREWSCGGCGVVHERDYNAARNIEREGVRTLAHEGESVRRLARTA